MRPKKKTPHPSLAEPSLDLSPQERGEVGAVDHFGKLCGSAVVFHLSPFLRGEVGESSSRVRGLPRSIERLP
jgi:hypothetical protein